MYHNKDILWKGLLEWVFDDLLRFIFPNADEVFDMEKGFSFLDKELAEMYPEPEKKADVRVVDKLVKVFRKNGEEEWVLVHLEVQAKTDAKDRPLFPERMFRYFIRCFDRYRRPVTAIAIFTGPDARRMPGSYYYSFMNTRLAYQYNTLCILDYTDKVLEESKNPFAWIVLLAKKALLKGKEVDGKLLEGKLFIFRKMHADGTFDKEKMRAILTFLDNYVRFENPENNRIFINEIDNLTGKMNFMDIFQQVEEIKREEGVEEGLKKGLENSVKALLSKTEFSPEKIAYVLEVPLTLVKKIKKEMRAKNKEMQFK